MLRAKHFEGVQNKNVIILWLMAEFEFCRSVVIKRYVLISQNNLQLDISSLVSDIKVYDLKYEI